VQLHIENDMTDPMDALNGLQTALNAGTVQLRACDLHPDLKVLLDHPNGKPRFTYALVDDHTVQAISLFVLIEPYKGLPCFQVGYAVLEALRGKGTGSRVFKQSIAELANGLRRTPMKDFYLEAVVATGNDASNAIARRHISESPIACTDEVSNEQALQYFRRISCDA
jgi:hypothetical protein